MNESTEGDLTMGLSQLRSPQTMHGNTFYSFLNDGNTSKSSKFKEKGKAEKMAKTGVLVDAIIALSDHDGPNLAWGYYASNAT